jgi:hypothetical protein
VHKPPARRCAALAAATIALVAEPTTLSLDEQLKEIGAQLAWVRDYL